VLETLRALMGCGSIDFGARPFRAGEVMELYADITRIRAITSWTPAVPLKEGLRRTVTYYRGVFEGG
jgi:nucleoside-diphosphate-sugar epimerase